MWTSRRKSGANEVRMRAGAARPRLLSRMRGWECGIGNWECNAAGGRYAIPGPEFVLGPSFSEHLRTGSYRYTMA